MLDHLFIFVFLQFVMKFDALDLLRFPANQNENRHDLPYATNALEHQKIFSELSD